MAIGIEWPQHQQQVLARYAEVEKQRCRKVRMPAQYYRLHATIGYDALLLYLHIDHNAWLWWSESSIYALSSECKLELLEARYSVANGTDIPAIPLTPADDWI